MISTVVFFVLSAVLLFSALMVVTQRNVFTCAMYLAVALSMVAGLFVLLSADFLAAVQILLYVGGILVILVFAVMLSSVQQQRVEPQVNEQWLPALIGCLGLVSILLIALRRADWNGHPLPHHPTTGSIAALLFGDMILPFEVVSLVLLASLIGAVLFSQREKKDSGPGVAP